MSTGNKISANGPARFLTTRWSLVLSASGEDEQARASLEELCGSYWYPLYAFVRHSGKNAAEAEDSTQAFFLRLLERRDIAAADPERGRFRSYLLTALRNFLTNEWHREVAEKRGGGRAPLSIDWSEANERYGREPATDITPEKLFDRSWALETLDRAMRRLDREFKERGKEELCAALRPALVGGKGDIPLREIAEQIGSTEGAVKVALHRMRQQFRDCLRAEIGETLEGPEEVEAELMDLMDALGA